MRKYSPPLGALIIHITTTVDNLVFKGVVVVDDTA